MSDSESLFDKLKSMGMHVGTSHIPQTPQRRKHPHAIENVVQGKDLETPFGLTFMTQALYDGDYCHGCVTLCADRAMEVFSAWSGAERITQPGGRNVIFLDTETSGLMGGTGTYVFLIGLGYRTENGFELVQLFMRDPGQESALLAALDQWLGRFNVVVTFNGKGFDLPLLNTRYTMNGMESPFPGYEHVDVLTISRKLWRDRLPSRALGELEKAIIQFYRTGEDIPGWMIPDIYFNYLRTGDARELAGVFYHNAIDILSLAALYGHVAGMLQNPLQEASAYALDLAAIARLYEDMERFEDAAILYERSLELGDLPDYFYAKIVERYAQMYRRRGEWARAVELWRKSAERGECSACIELAKYYEHRERNYMEALIWARKGLENVEVDSLYGGQGRALEKEIEKRIGRLYQRVYRAFDRPED